MVGKLILQGLIAGICAGLLAFGFARFFGEPAIETAVQFESSQEEASHAAGHHDDTEEPEEFSRAVQGGIGLLTGVVVVGAGLGALFAVLFALAYGRIGTWGPGATCALLALLGWISVYLVPALKYPANPPAVGEPGTIRMRTALYFLAIAISIALTVGAWMMGRRLSRRYGPWQGCVAALVAYLVVLGVVFQLLPPINEVPRGFPAATLWDFRVASVGLQLVLWGGVGLIFGTMVEISQTADRSPRDVR